MGTEPDILETTADLETPLKANIHEKPDIQPGESNVPENRVSTLRPKVNAWSILLVHLGVCVAIALSIALAVHGYEALDDKSATHASYVGGKLILRVGDVTMLISAALVVVKLSRKRGRNYARKTGQMDDAMEATAMVPPTRRRTDKPPPMGHLSRALDHHSPNLHRAHPYRGCQLASKPVPATDVTVSVAAVDSRADFGGWKWYNYPFTTFGLDRKPYLRTAAGYASMVWSDPSNLSPNGTSLTGNGCRHVVPGNDALGQNATLLKAVVPCIQIHSIDWYKADDDDVGLAEWVYVADSSSLSLVDDSPSTYYRDGVTVVFDTAVGWNDSQAWYSKPTPTVFSKTQTVGMMVERVAKQTRVVEDQTPLEEVVFAENPRVQEAVRLLPDLTTMIAAMNSTLLPTFDNIDGYVELLMRQAYLAAWYMYHDSFDEDQKGDVYLAIPSVSRQLADVSFARDFAWLAMCALMSVSGALLLVAVLRGDDLKPPEEDLGDARVERRQEGFGGFTSGLWPG
ncbi:hypothetical protein EDB80DRAFT_820362 [Ilyonectria destructans]|nr:hypothetical protein EDB80DRAFT_820362 [Ilyonectria destructans]